MKHNKSLSLVYTVLASKLPNECYYYYLTILILSKRYETLLKLVIF